MAKLSKEDHAIVRRALTSHERLTGERAAHLIDSIEVESDQDPAAKQKAAQEAYNAQAELNRKVEETHQAERRARAGGRTPDDIQPGNPGAGQEALVTERAKALGISPHGREPETAAPSR